MARDPKTRRTVPWVFAASTIARASRRNSSSPKVTKFVGSAIVARRRACVLPRVRPARTGTVPARFLEKRQTVGVYKAVPAKCALARMDTRRRSGQRQKLDERTAGLH